MFNANRHLVWGWAASCPPCKNERFYLLGHFLLQYLTWLVYLQESAPVSTRPFPQAAPLSSTHCTTLPS